MIYPKMLFFCADFRGIRSKLHRRMTRAVVSREAYGVRGACSRCRMCGAVRKREQAPRTPYASRGLIPVMPAWGQTRPTPYLITNEDRIALDCAAELPYGIGTQSGPSQTRTQ